MITNPKIATDSECQSFFPEKFEQVEEDIERVLKVQMVLTALLMLPVIYYLAVPCSAYANICNVCNVFCNIIAAI